MLIPGVRGSKNHIRNYLLLGLAGILLVLLVPAIGATPAPAIRSEFGGATIDISASSAWSMGPGDCMTIRWDVEGIRSIYIDGQGKIGWGEMEYCPSFRQSSPRFEITAKDGTLQRFSLDIHYLPNQVIACLLLVAIASLFVLAFYYFVTLELDKPPPFRPYMLLVLAIAVLGCMVCIGSGLLSIRQLLSVLKGIFGSASWHLFGVILAAIVYVPLAAELTFRGIKQKSIVDFVVIASFIVFLMLLYLPYGVDGVAHKEGWENKAYLESGRIGGQLATRFWALVPNVLANLLSAESFASLHLVYLFMLWVKSVCFYGILRRLKVSPTFAFLCAMLFTVYPVNTMLMNLRSIQPEFSVVSLLAAAAIALDYRENPSRLRLIGIWLAILFNIGTYEAGYVVIAVVPLYWLCRRPMRTWQSFNLIAIWYLFPAAKVAYLVIISAAKRSFYGSYLLKGALESQRSLLDSLMYYAEVLLNIYLQTFVYGWQEAVTALNENEWLAPVLAALILVGLVSVCLDRSTSSTMFPSRRQTGLALLTGLFFIVPSVGVLVWPEKFNQDLWRLYIYVSIGAAIAILFLIVLLSLQIKNLLLRRGIIVCVCLVLMLPALARLHTQRQSFVGKAHVMAKVLWQIVEQAPQIDPEANVILLTDMGLRELGDIGIYDFRRFTFGSAINVLYGKSAPRLSVLCWGGRYCSSVYGGMNDHDLANVVSDASKLLLFRLYEDLSVELLRTIPSELGISDRDNYDAGRLIDTSASVPSRAKKMLSSARRASINP